MTFYQSLDLLHEKIPRLTIMIKVDKYLLGEKVQAIVSTDLIFFHPFNTNMFENMSL